MERKSQYESYNICHYLVIILIIGYYTKNKGKLSPQKQLHIEILHAELTKK